MSFPLETLLRQKKVHYTSSKIQIWLIELSNQYRQNKNIIMSKN